MVLTVCDADGTICYFHNIWDLVLPIDPTGKIYSYIPAWAKPSWSVRYRTGGELDDGRLKKVETCRFIKHLKLTCVDNFLRN